MSNTQIQPGDKVKCPNIDLMGCPALVENKEYVVQRVAPAGHLWLCDSSAWSGIIGPFVPHRFELIPESESPNTETPTLQTAVQ